MNTWTIKSNSSKQNLVVWIGMIMGLVLVISLRSHFGIPKTTESAGFWLGVLLLLPSSWGIIFLGDRIVSVNPITKLLVIEDSTILGRTQRAIPFSLIRAVEVESFGDNEGGSITYDLVLRLKNSPDKVSLFGRGYFDGRFDKEVRENQKNQLESNLGLMLKG